jgi:hypothetical protein
MAARVKHQKTKKINLLAQEEFAGSIMGRILSWALSTFRIIVIAIEIVVVIAFLSRFWLDARITDLNDDIKQKVAIITSQNQFETKFRSAQSRLNILDQVTKDKKSLEIINSLSSYLPEDAKMVSFSISNKEIQIKANAFRESSASQYLTNLRSQDFLSDVEIIQVDTTADNPFIIFSVKAKLN